MAAWDGDKLGRKEEGEFLINYLTGRYADLKERERPDNFFVLNLNAEWGSGKTYFMQNLALDLREKNHIVVEFDAWKNDYTKEPLLAFMSEMNSALERFFTQEAKNFCESFKGYAKAAIPIMLSVLAKKATGYTIHDLLEIENASDDKKEKDDDTEKGVESLTNKLAEYALKEHNTIKKSIAGFKKHMGKLIDEISQERSLPLFILIDELDRCRPSYAIELLENIKHIFDIDGLYFIVATNSTQLAHSINAVYGNNFDSEMYLKRFFDQEYRLKEVNAEDYIAEKLQQFGLLDSEKFFVPLNFELNNKDRIILEIFEAIRIGFELTARDIGHVITLLYSITVSWGHQYTRIHLPYMLFLIALYFKNTKEFNNFKINKPNSKTVLEKFKFNNQLKFKFKFIRDTFNIETRAATIHEILEYYIKLDLEDIYNPNSPNGNLMYDYKYFILNENNSNYRSIEADGSKILILKEYKHIISCAGMLSMPT